MVRVENDRDSHLAGMPGFVYYSNIIAYGLGFGADEGWKFSNVYEALHCHRVSGQIVAVPPALQVVTI